MAYLIGTAGHVDHGKTTLIAALTGIDADRLPEEKARGMTIDIGFAYLDLEGVGRVSIVDVPGHERFIKNMLAGASGVDVGLLCVAADEGVMPQTREHFQILNLLEARKLVVAMTKCDVADKDAISSSITEVRDLLSATRFADCEVVKTSATDGAGLNELKGALADAIAELGPRESSTQWFMPIDRVFTIAGHGTVVTGTLAAGRITLATDSAIVPGSVSARIRSIHTHANQVDSAEAGQRVALNLGGVRKESLERGQAIGSPGTVFETSCFNVRVKPVAELKHGQRVRVHIGAGEFIGKIFLFDDSPDTAQIRTEEPIACAKGQRVVIRRYSPPDVLAGGEIITPNATARRKSDSQIQAMAQESGDSLEESILRAISRRRVGMTTEAICEALGQSAQALGNTFETLKSTGRAFGFAGIWMSTESYQAIAEEVRSTLQVLHTENAQASSIPKSQVLQRTSLKWPPKSFDRLVAKMAEDRLLRLVGSGLKHPDYEVTLNEKQRALLTRVTSLMHSHGALAPSVRDLAAEGNVPSQAIEEIVRLGVDVGEIIKVDEGMFYAKRTLDDLRQTLRGLGAAFTVAQFRDATGSSRKYALPILQYFDEAHFTKRVGDERIIIG